MTYNYSIKNLKENMAKALGSDMPISFKQSIEICNYIRGDKIPKAKLKLQQAIDMKKPIPFKKYTEGAGHKPGKLASGKYPLKACGAILKLLNSAEANALYKGLNSKGLVIAHLSVKQAPQSWHYGRRMRRKMKRCHIEIILEEVKVAGDKQQPKTEKKDVAKPEVKSASVKSAPAKPAEVKSVEAKSIVKEGAKPVEAKPIEKKPEVKPAEVKEQPKAEPKQESQSQDNKDSADKPNNNKNE